jgi:DNA-directed RNA polymerase specialized sigma24 family protein
LETTQANRGVTRNVGPRKTLGLADSSLPTYSLADLDAKACGDKSSAWDRLNAFQPTVPPLRDRSELWTIIASAMDRLDPVAQDIFVSHYLLDQAVPEVSRTTGHSTRDVEEALIRTRSTLRSLLAKNGYGPWR